jgi:hypothetical protein
MSSHAGQERLVRVWNFADAYLMPFLQNAAMVRFMDILMTHYVAVDTVRLVVEETAYCSLLWDAVMKDLVSGCINNMYSVDEMDAIGAIPEALSEVVKRTSISVHAHTGCDLAEMVRSPCSEELGKNLIPET